MKTLSDWQLEQLVELVTDACDLREGEDGRPTWDCDHDLRRTRQALEDMGLDYLAIEAVLEELEHEAGYFCDCEVCLNAEAHLKGEGR